MPWVLHVMGWLGMMPVFAVAICGGVFGAGLPVVLALGIVGRADERATMMRGTASGGTNARRRRSAA